MKGESIKENSELIEKYGSKIIPKLLVYLGKLKSASQYEEYLKQLNVVLFQWFFLTFVTRAFLIFICLLVADATISHIAPTILGKAIAAEGISILWYLWLELLGGSAKKIRGEKNG